MTVAKAVVAGIGLIVTALTAAFADDIFDLSEMVEFAVVVGEVAVGTWAVWKVRNVPPTT
jgi:hypothetical protein